MELRRLPVVALFALLASAYLAWSWSPVLGGFDGDNASYLFMARHYSPYADATPLTEHFAASNVYPPLFPLLLGLTGGGESLLAAHLVTTLFLLGAFGLWYGWVRHEGVGPVAAPVALLLLASLPGVYLQTFSVHSENLFLLFTLATLAWASRAQEGGRTGHWMLGALVALAAAYLTRGAGLALIAAWLGWLWINRLPGRVLLSLLALLPVVLWGLFGSAGATGYWQQLVQGYQDPAALLNQIGMQGRYLFSGWLANFGDGRVAVAAGALLAVLGLAAAAWRTGMRRIDGLLVWAYLGMALLWPFPAEAQRLALVLLPVLLGQALWALHRLRTWTPAAKPIQVGVLAALLLAVLPELALNAQRLFAPLPAGVPEGYRHTSGWYLPDPEAASTKVRIAAALESGMAGLSAQVPEQGCVYAIKPAVVAYLSGRMSKAPPGVQADPAAFERGLQEGRCRYLYLLPFPSPSYPVPMYPADRLQGRVEVLEKAQIQDQDGRVGTVGVLARFM